MSGQLTVLDLFSGIGGFSLGLERAGMRIIAFCEIDPWCRRVLRKHWPDVPVYDDVRTLTVDKGWLVSNADERCEPAEQQLCAGRQRIRANRVDVICGGFPCQDISVAGKGAGLAGERSGLWAEYARIIGEVRPRYVIVENVAALLSRGLGDVLGDLATLGFSCEWHCIPASAVGAPHRRDRVWIVAYAAGERQRSGTSEPRSCSGGGQFLEGTEARSDAAHGSEDVADADSAGRQQQRWGVSVRAQLAAAECADWWRTEPDVGRVASRLSPELDGGLNETPMVDTQDRAARSLFGEYILRELRQCRTPATASSELRQANGNNHSMSSMPCESGSVSGLSAREADEGMQGLRQSIPSATQQETFDMQPRVSRDHWPHECGEALGQIWSVEPDVGRIAHGVRNRVDRLRSLGNSVVPQIPEILGRAIMRAEP